MIKVFLVDDELQSISTLTSALHSSHPRIQIVGSASSADEAFSKLNNISIDVLFLDIEMGKESGFHLLERFNQINFNVVFVTAHEEFALRAIKFSALDYIIKPPSLSELKHILTKFEKSTPIPSGNQKIRQMFGNFLMPNKSDHKVTLPILSGFEFVAIEKIIYLKADTSYTIFHLLDSRKITATKNLKHYEDLLGGYGFFRIHNSTLINLRYIRQVQKSAGGYVVMENGDELSLSKSRKASFMETLALR